MTIYATDADFYTLQFIEKSIHWHAPASRVRLFTNPADTWDAFSEDAPDVLFAELSDYGALTLIKKVNNAYPTAKIVLLSDGAYLPPEYINMKVDTLLRKPLTAEAVRSALTKNRIPAAFPTAQKQGAIAMTKRSSILLLILAVCLIIGAFVTLLLTHDRSSDLNGTIYVKKEDAIRSRRESEGEQTASEPVFSSLRYDTQK